MYDRRRRSEHAPRNWSGRKARLSTEQSSERQSSVITVPAADHMVWWPVMTASGELPLAVNRYSRHRAR